MNIDELMLNLEAAKRMLGGEAEVKIVLPASLDGEDPEDLEGMLLHIASDRFSVHTPDGAAWIHCVSPEEAQSRLGDKNEEMKYGAHYYKR